MHAYQVDGLRGAFGLWYTASTETNEPILRGAGPSALEPGADWSEEGVRQALVAMARRMENDDPATGIGALDQVEERLRAAADVPEARQWVVALARDIASEPGPALGRRRLRDFVREATDAWPGLARLQLSVSLTRAGDAWQTFEKELRQASTDETLDLSQALTYLLAVRTFEETFWDRVLSSLTPSEP